MNGEERMKQLESEGITLKSDWCLDCVNVRGCPSCCNGLPPTLWQRFKKGLKNTGKPVGYSKDKTVAVEI